MSVVPEVDCHSAKFVFKGAKPLKIARILSKSRLAAEIKFPSIDPSWKCEVTVAAIDVYLP